MINDNMDIVEKDNTNWVSFNEHVLERLCSNRSGDRLILE